MSGLIAFIFGPGGVYAVLAGLIGAALLYARKTGKDSVKAEQVKERMKARSEAEKIDQAVAGMSDEEVIKEQAKWSRKR